MKIDTRNKLKAVKTLNEYLNFLQNEFKSKDCKPGYLSKSTLCYFIADLCKNNGVKIPNFETIKNKAIDSNNIFDFIEIIKKELNADFNFSSNAKDELFIYTNKICLFINLQIK